MGINGENFVVTFKNHRCGYGKLAYDYELAGLPIYKTDKEHYIYVFCYDCYEFMDYNNGWWVCPECGSKTRQQSAYSAAGRAKPKIED